ncbi:MAG: SDR family NAD(P)-dependent oxidoreductase, partial [Deinococcus-Thermus bacterium]|nr:SDR family NAD(P)-dependent oxidoreductase [Deinococcota bacterium]
MADDLARDVLALGPDRSVAYRGMDRWVQGVEPAAIQEAPAAAPQVREGGVYLITGGLGGIGLQMAEHLARLTPVQLVLTSRSGLPPREAWKARLSERGESDPTRRKIQAVLALEALGAEVLVGTADVTDRDAMGALMEEVRARFGRVDGVIHAAGVVDDDLLPLKDAEAAARVLAPKVEGTLVLDAALEDAFGGGPLDFFVLFSSVSALVGLPGQIDYTAANAFLDAFAQRKQAVDGVPALSINWSAWQEVGMAAEIAAGDEPGAEDGEPVAHPLLDRRRADADGAVFQSTLAPRNHWILDGHRNTHGEAILPGTGYLELARAAFAEASGQDAIALGEVYFVSPLEIRSGTQRRLRVRLEPGEEGMAFTVESQPAGGEAGAEAGATRWDEHANGTARALDEAPDERHDIAAVADRCTRDIRTFGPDDRTRQEKHLRFGPRWRCLREVRYGEGEALARLELPEVFAGDLRHYKLHPALLDMATGFGLPLVDGYEARDDFYVPLSYEAFRLYRPLPRQLHSHMRCRNASEQEMPAFDVTLTGADGQVVAEVTAFTMKRVPAGALAGPSPRQQGAPATGSTDGLAFDVSTGILPAEGTEAFDRILASRPRPQVIVSTVDLPAWQAKIDETTAPAEEDEDAEGDAPATTGDEAAAEADAGFIAPRDDVERTIADIWKGMLGLDRVGLHDDFFDVGGHSLIAVRMFAKVRKAYGLDLPLAVLMEAPTLGGFAEVVRGELGLESPDEAVAEEGPAEEPPAEEGPAAEHPAEEGFAEEEDPVAKDVAAEDAAEAQGAEEERTAEREEPNVSEKPKAPEESTATDDTAATDDPAAPQEPEPSIAGEPEPPAPGAGGAARAQSGDGALSPPGEAEAAT